MGALAGNTEFFGDVGNGTILPNHRLPEDKFPPHIQTQIIVTH
jgi:hypothetical protein